MAAENLTTVRPTVMPTVSPGFRIRELGVRYLEPYRLAFETLSSPKSVLLNHEALSSLKPSVPAVTLEPATVASISRSNSSSGKAVYGTLCEEPVKVAGGIQAAMVEDDGTVVRLVIYHALNDKYHVGARVAVKEPVVLDEFSIEVTSPANVEIITYFPKLNAMDAETARKQGNVEFKNKEFRRAAELYSLSIQDAESNGDVAKLLMAYSNRAECHLELNMFEAAFGDSSKALAIQPGNVKALLRMGKALHGMEMYRLATQAFNAAMEHRPPQIKEVQEWLARSQSFNDQVENRTQQKIIADCYENGDTPEFCNFVGDVEIRNSGTGLGLYATYPIKAGEIFLVSNKIGTGGKVIASVSELIRAGTASPRILEQLYCIADKAKGAAAAPPPMFLFKPNSELVHHNESSVQMDLAKMYYVLQESYQRGWNGSVWLLPSFMRHSCAGNVLYFMVGDSTMVFRTNRDVEAGEELSYPHRTIIAPLSLRRKQLKHTECGCQVCNIESRFKELEDFNRRFVVMLELFVLSGWKAHRVLGSIAVELEEFLVNSSGMDENEKNMVRAVYYQAYSAYYHYVPVTQHKMLPLNSFLRMILDAFPGDMKAVTTLERNYGQLLLQFEAGEEFRELLVDAAAARYGRLKMSTLQRLVGVISKGMNPDKVLNKAVRG